MRRKRRRRMTMLEPRNPFADADILARCPTLRAYVSRVGDKVKSFRRFVVEEQDENGYPRAVATVVIKDGKISCDSEEHGPTDAETSAIEAEVAAANLPNS